MELYLHSGTDFTITDERGEKYSVRRAKEFFETGAVKNYNLAFWRLVRNNFDLEKTKQSYCNNYFHPIIDKKGEVDD